MRPISEARAHWLREAAVARAVAFAIGRADVEAFRDLLEIARRYEIIADAEASPCGTPLVSVA